MAQRPPRYVVDLDAPAEERWREVIEDHADGIREAAKLVEEILGTGVRESMATSLFTWLAKSDRMMFADEIRAISAQLDVPVGHVALLQLAYDIFAACTSIVTPSDEDDGSPVLVRTMDWEMPSLEPITVNVDFHRDGELLFRATTWAGYIGVLTGCRRDVAAVSVNFRVTEKGGVVGNLWKGARGAWPVSFLVRSSLTDADSYEMVVQWLKNSKLMAPTYLTVAGVEPGQGCIISRDRDGCNGDRIQELGERLCIQTNMDHWRDADEDEWQDIMWSSRRRLVAHAGLTHLRQSRERTRENLASLMLADPIFNDITIYTSLLCPRTGELDTWLRPSKQALQSGRRRWAAVVAAHVDECSQESSQESSG